MSEDQYGINSSTLRSLVTLFLTTQVWAVSQVDFLMDAFYTILDLFGNCAQNTPIPPKQNARHVLNQTQMIYKDVRRNAMQTNIEYNAHCDKNPTLQSSDKQITYMSYSRKQIIKGLKFILQNLGGFLPTFLKNRYPITTIW